jgi:hypothetical protein
MGGGRRHLDDIVEGKLFLGGIDPNTTTETLESYCSGWCVRARPYLEASP